jgi:dCMP deaminase
MIEKDLRFLKIAKIVAENSTCARVNVGAVITKNKRIISTGWNGSSSKSLHCCDHFKNVFSESVWKDGKNPLFKYPTEEHFDEELAYKKWKGTQEFYDVHGHFSNLNELHAEQNAILFADREQLKDSTLYITLSSCLACSKVIIISGIKRVVYSEVYDRETQGLELMKSNGISVEHIEAK